MRDVLEATTQCKHNAKSNGCLRWKSRPETEILGDGLEKRLFFFITGDRGQKRGIFTRHKEYLHRIFSTGKRWKNENESLGKISPTLHSEFLRMANKVVQIEVKQPL